MSNRRARCGARRIEAFAAANGRWHSVSAGGFGGRCVGERLCGCVGQVGEPESDILEESESVLARATARARR